MQNGIARFDPTRADGLRWADVYTTSGGTDANSQNMAASATTWLANAKLSSSLLDDDTTTTLPDTAYAHPVLFKHTALVHDDVPRYYFEKFTQNAGFRALP
jgi:hypothetical protein